MIVRMAFVVFSRHDPAWSTRLSATHSRVPLELTRLTTKSSEIMDTTFGKLEIVHDCTTPLTSFLALLASDCTHVTSAIHVTIERHTVAAVIWQDEA